MEKLSKDQILGLANELHFTLSEQEIHVSGAGPQARVFFAASARLKSRHGSPVAAPLRLESKNRRRFFLHRFTRAFLSKASLEFIHS